MLAEVIPLDRNHSLDIRLFQSCSIMHSCFINLVGDEYLFICYFIVMLVNTVYE